MADRHCCMWFVRRCCIVLAAFLLVLATGVDGSATLQLRMIRFDNPKRKLANGKSCDSFGSRCDSIFQFSIDRGDSNNSPRPSTRHYWSATTGHYPDRNPVVFGDNMRGVLNPIVKSFPSWPSVGVKFKVIVTDKDVLDDDEVDDFVQLLKPPPALNESVANETELVMIGNRKKHKTRLTITHKLYCDANYYSSDCSVYCVASDSDTAGHYTCDPITGNITCRPGWEDESKGCITFSDDCLNHRCYYGATCVDGVRNYTCLCPSGYTGARCDTDVNECAGDPCEHNGTCTDLINAFTCNCSPGYTGVRCEIDVNECAGDPCEHNGTCIDLINAFTCNCSPGYTGDLCSDALRTPSEIAMSTQLPGAVTSSPTWMYVVICLICIAVLVAVALIVFCCIKRRRATKPSMNQVLIAYESSTATVSPLPSLTPSSPDSSTSTAIYSVASDSVDLAALDSLSADDNRNCNNIYETIDENPSTSDTETSPTKAFMQPLYYIYDVPRNSSTSPHEPTSPAAAANASFYESMSQGHGNGLPASSSSSSQAAPVPAEAESVYVPANNSSDSVPPAYQSLEHVDRPTSDAYANLEFEMDVTDSLA